MADSIFYDGEFEEPIRISPIFPELIDNHIQVYRADYLVAAEHYSRGALDTQMPELSGAYLVEETPPSHFGGGLLEFTRTYSMIPETFIEWENITYEFPGMLAGGGNGRNPMTKTVPAEVTLDYYLTSNPSSIPYIEAQGYWGQGGVGYYLNGKMMGNVSIPTKAEYLTWMANGTMIVAQDSTIERVFGNLWRRRTIRVRAQ